ncbi:hypothetical protein [Burkholderia sp. Cy-637]|nr:hypothetical protein [Burkholderia sp. Cy-637]
MLSRSNHHRDGPTAPVRRRATFDHESVDAKDQPINEVDASDYITPDVTL